MPHHYLLVAIHEGPYLSIQALEKELGSDTVTCLVEGIAQGDRVRDALPYLGMAEVEEQNPQLKISLLNLDVDIYEPSVTVLEHLYPRIVEGGILILDDYGTFPGETKAVDDYFATKGVEAKVLTFPFCMTPWVEVFKHGHRGLIDIYVQIQ